MRTWRGGGGDHQTHHTEGARNEGAKGGDPQSRPCPSLPRHLVSIQTSHHRSGFSRDIDKDRGCGTSVHGSIIHAGQHDDRGSRRKIKGCRKQERDGGRGTKSGKHTYQRPGEDAEETIEKISPTQRHRKSG